MKMEINGEALRVSSITQLGEANAKAFRDWVRGALKKGHRNIEVDLSQTTFVDSSGLGALIALQKTAVSRKGKLLLLNPQPAVRQIIQLTRLDNFFEIVNSE
ncbi:MAG TPA: STAS domain-containing protein [Verrucomicrobiae bacterium]|jgi:anti-sigma B factor antagonist|nr:STAS domain-containing protein [Verrucomicrobiae bacterium]